MSHRLRHLFAASLLTFASIATLNHAAAADPNTGTWTKRYQAIDGSWEITDTAEGRFLVLDNKFKTRNAPDLKLFLSPRTAADVTAKNALEGSVLIAPLTKAKGGQSYALPAGLDLTAYETLVLQCEQYTKLWGVSPLHN